MAPRKLSRRKLRHKLRVANRDLVRAAAAVGDPSELTREECLALRARLLAKRAAAEAVVAEAEAVVAPVES